MDLGLSGRTALVTGASRGIGAAIARGLAAEGAIPWLVARDAAMLETVRTEIAATGIDPVVEICDVSDPAQVASLAERTGAPDILVNNAGAVPGGGLLDLTDAEWRKGWDSKVFAYLSMCRSYWPLMAARHGGTIVNVIGNGSRMKRFDYVCGGMANAALDFLTEALGAGGPAENIRVVGISPGPVNTDRYRRLSETREARSGKVRHVPFGRIPSPEEIADGVCMLASDRMGYVSGTVLVVDGGMSAARETVRRPDETE